MAADITSASSAPKKSARSDEEMISLRLRGVSAAGEGVEAVKFKGIQKSFKFYELRVKGLIMKTYPIPMVPGPVKAHPSVLEAYRVDYGSADLEKEYVELYTQTETNLKRILQTQSAVVIFLGEGMMALWGALKSCLLPGDRVLAVGTGVYGYGIGDMAASIGAEVRRVGLPYDQTLSDLAAVEGAVTEFKPKMITVVHCETPSGTLNPIDGLGRLKQEMGVPLLYVDAVSSIGGAPVLPDEWNIDLCLGGAQKCLSALPDTCFLSVSEKAWEVIDQVNYVGYDAVKPFKTAVEKHYFPYTPGWQATAGLNAGAEAVLQEGIEACFRRHAEAAAYCRQRLVEIGYSLYPAPGAVPSPTVTAVQLPEGVAWSEFDRRLRSHGLAVGGSYGPIAGKVFRLGHMGTQADRVLVKQALEILEKEWPAS
jgi:aspartate aminotransferase-like enzyme